MKLHMAPWLTATLAALLVASCATQRPPEGGPVDSEPPYIVQSSPLPGTVTFRGRNVVIEFNERVDKRSFDDAIHISPVLATKPEYDWSAREVKILFQEELPEDKTIVVTIGSNLKDLRAGNPMSDSWQLAFSTGDSLDRGIIEGIVSDAKPAGVSVFAYLLDEGRADTLDPTRHRPDYVVRTGDDGRFRLSYLREGLYRVFAVRDNLNNLLYDIEADEIGIPTGDVFAVDSNRMPSALRFTLHREDTTAPYVQRVQAVNARQLRIAFSEDVQPFPPPTAALTLRDSVSGEPLSVYTVLPSLQGRNAWDVYLGSPMHEGRFQIFFDSLRDAAGNALRTDVLVFDGSAVPDTSRPIFLETFPKDGGQSIPTDSAFVLRFSRPVQENIVVSILDSTGKQLPATVLRPDMTRVDIGHPVLDETAAYRLCIDLATIRDGITGRPMADSTFCIAFTTGKAGSFGSVTGNFAGDSLGGIPHILLREMKEGGTERRTIADSTGAFTFTRVPEGQYKLEAFIDLDSNGRYSPGSARPLLAPEPLIRYKDTLRVRARWETGGVKLRANE
jgi:hypothetical protein